MQYAAQILHAINIFEQSGQLSATELISLIQYKAVEGQASLATALYGFIPLAYCRELLSEVEHPDYYLRPEADGSYSRFLLASNALYGEVQQVVQAKFLHGLAENQMLSVLQHSPHFKAVNAALHEGQALENISLEALRF